MHNLQRYAVHSVSHIEQAESTEENCKLSATKLLYRHLIDLAGSSACLVWAACLAAKPPLVLLVCPCRLPSARSAQPAYMTQLKRVHGNNVLEQDQTEPLLEGNQQEVG